MQIRCILNLMLKWTIEILLLRFRYHVMSLTGSTPISGKHDDRKKENCFDLNRTARLSPAGAGLLMSIVLEHVYTHHMTGHSAFPSKYQTAHLTDIRHGEILGPIAFTSDSLIFSAKAF